MPGLEDAERLIAGLGRSDGRGDTAVTSLIPALSCPRPNPPFAELVRLSPMSIADEIRDEHERRLRKPWAGGAMEAP